MARPVENFSFEKFARLDPDIGEWAKLAKSPLTKHDTHRIWTISTFGLIGRFCHDQGRPVENFHLEKVNDHGYFELRIWRNNPARRIVELESGQLFCMNNSVEFEAEGSVALADPRDRNPLVAGGRRFKVQGGVLSKVSLSVEQRSGDEEVGQKAQPKDETVVDRPAYCNVTKGNPMFLPELATIRAELVATEKQIQDMKKEFLPRGSANIENAMTHLGPLYAKQDLLMQRVAQLVQRTSTDAELTDYVTDAVGRVSSNSDEATKEVERISHEFAEKKGFADWVKKKAGAGVSAVREFVIDVIAEYGKRMTKE